MASDFWQLLQNVLDELYKYKGEPIVKGEHPLHKAVVMLEGFCIPNGSGNGDRLFRGAAGHWYRGVHASRDNKPEEALARFRLMGEELFIWRDQPEYLLVLLRKSRSKFWQYVNDPKLPDQLRAMHLWRRLELTEEVLFKCGIGASDE